MLSKAAILAFLIVIGACVPFSVAARAPALAELQSEPAPVDNVPPQNLMRKCSTYKDCKGITCNSVDSVIWHVECVNGSCHCIPNEAAAPVELQYEPAPVDDVPSSPKTCSTVKDCKSITCDATDSVIWRVACVNGVCQRVPHETLEAPELPELQSEPASVDDVRGRPEKCQTERDCKGTKCVPEAGYHLECVLNCPGFICYSGTCQCVKDKPPQSDEPAAAPRL